MVATENEKMKIFEMKNISNEDQVLVKTNGIGTSLRRILLKQRSLRLGQLYITGKRVV
jgi:hypothetical protein